MENEYRHEWVRTPLKSWRVGVQTFYQHPGQRNPDHCSVCGVDQTLENRFDDCPEKSDLFSPHFIWPKR